ncbi:hypothetical protein CM19_05675 [Candidatus Acidianus copahuensis]|uniref:Uncharacterized protein n=2 Tax=Candidatus Acidianus copahuensis TaxID=1160895 RepID=A0A031LPF8_9CREN|nr:hypothetical protein CM19_05675 [Candidatus Acidianus copahuensis]
MALNEFLNTTSQIFSHFHMQANTISDVLLIAGFVIILVVLVSAIGYGMFKAFKALPSMSTRQFILFLVMLAIAMIIIGIILP